MTTNQVLAGVGLILVLAVGSQVLAGRLRIPALIVLLPVGFAAGVLIDDVDPEQLLGAAFSPLVSLAVAVILYDAGLGLDLARLKGHTRRVVVRLIWIGVLVTGLFGTLLAAPLLGMSRQAAVMIGAILVVSGPTVVGPLLGFVRPKDRLQRILIWEGSLIDPVGGVVGALVYHGVVASSGHHLVGGTARFLASVGIGAAGGVVGAALLWVLFRVLRLGEVLGTTAQLAAVIGVAALCDVLREDTGLIAAVVMGLAVANLPGIDVPARRPFFEALVSLILGVLFISISATVTPHSLRHVWLPALGLSAFLVLVVRPLVAVVSTLGTDLTRGERAFIGWMAPRGIVAAATASTFSAGLVAKGIGGAAKILPATFVVIVATVTLYGLTASPVARRLGVVRPSRSRPLLVGGDPWVVDLGVALKAAGLEVLMWAGKRNSANGSGGPGSTLRRVSCWAPPRGRRRAGRHYGGVLPDRGGRLQRAGRGASARQRGGYGPPPQRTGRQPRSGGAVHRRRGSVRPGSDPADVRAQVRGGGIGSRAARRGRPPARQRSAVPRTAGRPPRSGHGRQHATAPAGGHGRPAGPGPTGFRESGAVDRPPAPGRTNPVVPRGPYRVGVRRAHPGRLFVSDVGLRGARPCGHGGA